MCINWLCSHSRTYRTQRWSHVVIIFAAAFFASTNAASPRDIDWKVGKLGHLSQYIGTYRYDAVLQAPAVSAALRSLAGDDVTVIVANLAVAAPIAFIGSNLVLSGNARSEGGSEDAIVLIDIFDGKVRAGLLHDKRMKLFANDIKYRYLPLVLREFLRPRKDRLMHNSLPSNAEWIRSLRD